MLDGVNATNVDFVGTMRADAVPTRVSSGGALEFEFAAPFSFEASIRGIQGGEELFARQFIGNGQFHVRYEQVTSHPGFVMRNADADTLFYTFSAAQTPEPGTLLLLGSGLAAAAVRRRRRKAWLPNADQAVGQVRDWRRRSCSLKNDYYVRVRRARASTTNCRRFLADPSDHRDQQLTNASGQVLTNAPSPLICRSTIRNASERGNGEVGYDQNV